MRDFFGEEARIIGIDLNPSAKKWEKDGFEIFIGSQSDTNFWNNFTNEYLEKTLNFVDMKTFSPEKIAKILIQKEFK